jgi:hypothetical protein
MSKREQSDTDELELETSAEVQEAHLFYFNRTLKETDMARNQDSGKVVKAETSTTWEHGKLKLTLTRKSMVNPQGRATSEDKVTVVNKDGATRSPHSDGFMWAGSLEDFKVLSGSISALYGKVDEELFGAKPADGCACPTQHAMDCTK